MSSPLWTYADFSENRSRGLGSPNKFFVFVVTRIFIENEGVWPQMLCLLSSENEKEQAAKLMQCIDKSYACCLLSLKKRMINFFKKASQNAHTTFVVYKCAIVCHKGKMKLVQFEKIII